MMMRQVTALLLSSLLIWASLAGQAAAALIDTEDVLAVDSRANRITEVQAQLAREDVQRAMVDLGVDPLQAQLRVASLSDQELLQLQNQLDTLPAGGNILALIGAVFVVLLILEVVGVTHIFSGV